MKTLWPKYLLFKHKIEPINIEQIEFKTFENVIGEPITPPVLQKKENNKYICIDGNCRLSVAVKNEYTHVLSYVTDNEDELKFLKILNDLVYKNDKNKIPMNDFEFIFKDASLYALINKCKNLLTK